MSERYKYDPDNLIAGEFPTLVKEITVISANQTLPRGAVLGMITDSKKYTLAKVAATDGSQTPKVVLVEDLPADASDRTALAYTTGFFAKGKLTFGEGITAESAEDDLHARSVFLIETL